MILRWHHARKEYVFAWKDWPLWENAAIGRKLGEEGAKAVVHELIRNGNAEWSDAGKSLVTLMWHSTDEIAAKLFDFVRKNGMIGSVFTVYELHQGDDVLGTVRKKTTRRTDRRSSIFDDKLSQAKLEMDHFALPPGPNYFQQILIVFLPKTFRGDFSVQD